MGIRQSELLVESNFITDRGGNPKGGSTVLNLPRGQPVQIVWQDGRVGEDGQNGAFVEDVIEAVLQRLRFFQTSKFRCRENAVAITHIEDGLNMLDARTRKRLIAGIENSYETHEGNEA